MYTHHSSAQSYKKQDYSVLDQSTATYGLANSQYPTNSVRMPIQSTPTRPRNLSQQLISTSQSQIPTQYIQPVLQQSQQYIRSSSPIVQRPINTYYTQSVQPIYRLYNEPVQVVQQQQKIIREIEEVPMVHEIHHVNRPINVISMDEIENPWRSQTILLEKQLIELQLMLKKGPRVQQETKIIVVEDEAKIKRLEQEIQKLKAISQDNDDEIQHLSGLCDDAQYNIENAEEQAEAQVEEQNRELARWKKKFQELNKQFHDVEEEITMTEAQIESMQKRKMITTTSQIKTTSSRIGQMRDSGMRRSSASRNY